MNQPTTLKCRLWLGDCLDLITEITDASVDLIACDLPYDILKSKWDKLIPMDRLWAEYRRILKPNGTIVLTAAGLFTARLMLAGGDLFKYPVVWEKNRPTCPQHAAGRPMTAHEDVLIFSKGGIGSRAKNPMTYNPQGLVKRDKAFRRKASKISAIYNNGIEGAVSVEYESEWTNYPRSVLRFSTDQKVDGPAPETQKPVALMDWIIRTYSNPGDVILDNCLGSGTTGVAALAAGRNFIGIEKNSEFYETASRRIRDGAPEGVIFIDQTLAQPTGWNAVDEARWEAKRAAYWAAMGEAA